MLPAARAAAAVGDAVGPGAVPGHADKEAAVMAEIGRPPVLRIGHHLVQVGDHRIEIEGVEFGGVVEIATVGIGRGECWLSDVRLSASGHQSRLLGRLRGAPAP